MHRPALINLGEASGKLEILESDWKVEWTQQGVFRPFRYAVVDGSHGNIGLADQGVAIATEAHINSSDGVVVALCLEQCTADSVVDGSGDGEFTVRQAQLASARRDHELRAANTCGLQDLDVVDGQ